MSVASHIDEGSGPAVVFLHGVGSGKEGFSRQRLTLVEAGYRFIAVDAPGFGETLASDAGFEAHVGAVIGVLDHLGIERAIFVGHSLGGMTVQEIFAKHRERVLAMVLSATSPAFGKPGGDFQREFIAARLKPFEQGMTMPQFAASFAEKLIGPSPEEGTLSEIIDVMSAVPVESYIAAMRTITTFDRREQLGAVDVPTLLIAGSHDTNSPAPMMEKMASKIPHAHFILLDQTGHMAPIENSRQFNHHVLEFLGAVSPC
ncbi:alpha/beta fold hydrolase [Pseudahrensia aquimaris]|uniref:Alpha/beta fold hydrolase n=1 Tax=Pseudahrensia aquimaris TaxID=744461 RepID=A0ABW3FEC1_9HYPH